MRNLTATEAFPDRVMLRPSLKEVAVTTHLIRLSAIGLALAALLIAVDPNGVALADEESSGMEFIGVEDTMKVYQVEEIVIQRTRANRPTSPVAFTDMSAEQIDQVSYGQDVPMVLTSTPSTYAYSDAANGFGYTYLKIRGFDQNRLGIMMNGVPMNDPESHQVYWVDHGDVLAGAKSVQIQRGVGTTLFGASSFGGSVNVLTSPLSVEPGLHMNIGYGDYTESGLNLPVRTYRVAVASGPINDGTSALYGRYSRQNSEGYRVASAADMESFALGGLYAGEMGSHKLDILAGHEVSQFAWDGVSPDFGVDLDDRDQRRANYYAIYDNNVDDFTQVVTSLTSEIPVTDELSITNTAYYVDGDGFFEQFKEGRDFYDYGFEPITLPDSTIVEETDLVQRRWLKNSYWGLLPQATVPVGEGKVMFGAGLRRYESEHYGEIVWTDVDLPGDPLDRYYTYRADKTSFEGYAQVQYPVLQQTTVTAGLQYQGHRYDWEQEKLGNFRGYAFEVNHNFFNPRVGVKHSFSSDLSAYGSVSLSNREPSDSDYVDGDDPGSMPAFKNAHARTTGLDDPIVEPERVIDYELGVGYAQPRWSAQIGLYRLDFKDELIPIEGGRIEEEGRLRRANTGQTIHQGIELEAAAQPIDGLVLGGNLALARHRFVDHEIHAYWIDDYVGGRVSYDENVIPRSPELLGNLTASYSRGPVTLGGRLQHVGKQYIDGENTESLAIDAYSLLDLSASFDVARQLRLSRGLTVTARVNNVFDTLYETYGYSYYDEFPARQFSFYWPGPTRSFFLSIGIVL